MQYAIAHRTHVTNDIEIVRADGTVALRPERRGAALRRARRSLRVRERVRRPDRAEARPGCAARGRPAEGRVPGHPVARAAQSARADSQRARGAAPGGQRHRTRASGPTPSWSGSCGSSFGSPTSCSTSRASRATGWSCGASATDLRGVVRSAIETIAAADRRGRARRCGSRMPEDALWVDADFTRLAQAFGALLNNAVKYTDRGGLIEVTVAARTRVGRRSPISGHRHRHQGRPSCRASSTCSCRPITRSIAPAAAWASG